MLAFEFAECLIIEVSGEHDPDRVDWLVSTARPAQAASLKGRY